MPDISILPKLLQATGDVANFPTDIEATTDPVPKRPGRDEVLESLLDAGVLDRETASFLIQEDEERRERQHLDRLIQHKRQQLRSKDENDRGLISFLGPVPVGFQLGTFAGIENKGIRFLVDLVADPINFVSGVGALTKLGRASKFLTRGEKIIDAAEVSKNISRGADILGQSILDPKFAKEIKEAAEKFDVKRLQGLAKRARKDFTPEQLKKIAAADDDLAVLLRNKGAEIRGLKAAFELRNKKIAKFQAGSKLDQILEGQRGLLNLRIPLLGVEGSIRLPALTQAIKQNRLVDAAIKKPAKAILEATREAGIALNPFLRTGADVDKALSSLSTTDMMQALDKSVELFKKNLNNPVGDLMISGSNAAKTVSGDMNGVRNLSRVMGMSIKRLLQDTPGLADKVTRAIDEGKDLTQFGDLSPVVERIQDIFNISREAGVSAEVFSKQFGEIADDAFETYVTHMFKFTGTAEEAALRKHLTRWLQRTQGRRALPGNRFALTRAFETIKEAEKWMKRHPEARIEVATTDIAEIVSTYSESFGMAVVRNRMIQGGLDSRAFDGLPLMIHETRTPRAILKRIKDKHLDRYAQSRNQTFNKIAIHKSIERELAPLIERDMIQSFSTQKATGSSAIVRGMLWMNSVGKTSLFNLNPLFHAATLTYSNFALLPFRDAAANSLDTFKLLVETSFGRNQDRVIDLVTSMHTRSMKSLDNLGVNGVDFIDLMNRSDLRLGSEAVGIKEGFNHIRNLMDGIAARLPEGSIGEKMALGARGVNDMFDRSLWTVLHSNMKVSAWQHVLFKEMQRAGKKTGTMPVGRQLEELAGEAAQIVNQAYGGLAWERLGANPTWQRMARLALLAPDWTMSNMLMARDMVLNMPGFKELAGPITRDVIMSDVRFRWALGYNLRAAFYGTVGGAIMNHIFTGKFTWDNDNAAIDPATGFKTRIELPWKREDGRRQFMDIYKQFAEPVRLFSEPLELVRAKIGVLPRVFSTLILGEDSFGNKIKGAQDGPYQAIVKQVHETFGQFAPISGAGFAQAASGLRDPRSVALSSVLGVSIRSEPKTFFDRRERLKELLDQRSILEAAGLEGLREFRREQR